MSNSFDERENEAARPVRFRIKDVPAMFSEGPEPEPPEQARFRWPETRELGRKLARSGLHAALPRFPFWPGANS